MSKITLLFFIFCFNTILFSQTIEQKITKIDSKIDSLEKLKIKYTSQKEDLQLAWGIQKMNELGLPKNNQKEEITTHLALILSYNEKHEQANWVMHIITPDIITGNTSRTNDFRPDPMIKTGSSEESDYFTKLPKPDGSGFTYDGFGFDRGHLAPSADFRWSEKALSESYFYSNMSPQVADFNRGKWAELEGWMREYVETNHTYLAVVTVPVLNDSLLIVQKSVNQVSIPKMYLKVVLDVKNNRCIAFYMPNEKITKPIESFAITVDQAEKILGYNLFSNLNDELENKLEASLEVSDWLPKTEKGDVVAISKDQLPKGAINSYEADKYINDEKVHTVCGTVVSSKKHDKGHVFMNLDKKFPNQIFSITIFESNIKNFSYEPEVHLIDKQVCVTGKISEYNGTPSIVLNNEKSVKLLSEY